MSPRPNRRPASPDLDLTFVGHATVLIELDGVRVLTDPLLGAGIGPIRRVVAPIAPNVTRDIDLVLISHAHLDHLDPASIRRLGDAPTYVVPEGVGARVRAAGATRIAELSVGSRVAFGPLEVVATTAIHTVARLPFRLPTAAIGFLVRGSRTFYFAGDTDIFPGMADLAPGLDLALLPVWGWGPRLGAGHLDPLRAAEALRLLQPTAALPIHWGTLWPRGLGRIGAGRLVDPPREFAAAAAVIAPRTRVLLLQPGERSSI